MIQYRSLRGAKYELTRAHSEICPPSIERYRRGGGDLAETEPRIAHGLLTIPAGFRWDGASGPALDTPDTMLPSLVHDACYRMIQQGRLDPRARRAADQWFRRLLRREGMAVWRRWAWWIMLRLFGGLAAGPMR